MADEGGFESLLLELGIDLTPFQTAAESIRSTLNQLQQMTTDVETSVGQAASAQGAVLSDVETAGQAAAQAATEAVAAQRMGTDEVQKQLEAIQQQIAQRKLETAELEKGAAAASQRRSETEADTAKEDEKLATLRLQTAEMAKQKAEAAEKKEGGEGGGGSEIAGALQGLLGKVTEGALGTGLTGEIAGGVIAGEGLVGIITAAGTALASFVEKLKDVTIESGSIVALENVFQGLAKGAGVDATVMMNNLNKASEGLATRFSLLRLANIALSSNLDITPEKLDKLTEATVKLAESSGHPAQSAIDTLYTSIARGRPIMLASVTGVEGLRDVMRDIPPVMNAAQRSALEFNRTYDTLVARADKLPDLPETLEKAMGQLKTSANNLMIDFAIGVNTAPGIREIGLAVDQLDKKMASLSVTAQKAGMMVGDAIGLMVGAFRTFAPVVRDLVHVFEEEFGILGDLYSMWRSFLDDVMGPATGVTNSLFGSTDSLQQKFVELHPVIGTLALGFMKLSEAIQLAVAGVGAMASGVKDLTGMLSGEDPIQRNLDKLVTLPVKPGDDAAEKALTRLKRVRDEYDKLSKDKFHGSDDLRNQMQDKAASAGQTYIDAAGIKPEELSANPGAAYAASAERIRKQNKEAQDGMIQDIQDFADKLGDVKSIPRTPADNSLTPQQQAQIAQARLKEETAEAKERLAAKKDDIEKEKEMDSAAYADGLETFSDHQKNLLTIAQQTHDAQLQELKDNLDAQNKAVDIEVKAGTKLRQVADLDKAAYEAQYRSGVLTADTQLETARSKIALDGIKQRQSAAIEAARAEEQRVAQKQNAAAQLAQKQVQSGDITPDTFFTERVDQIETIAQAQIKAANEVYQNSENNAKSLEVRAAAIDKAIQTASDKMDQLMDAQAQLDLRTLEHQFQPQQAALQQQLQAYQQQRTEGSNVPVTGTLEALQGNLSEQLESYQRLLTNLNESGQQHSDIWWQTYQRMESVYALMTKYNEELQKSKDLAQPLGEIFQSLDNIAGLWSSKWAKNFTEVFGQSIKALEESSSRRDIILNALGKGPQVQKSPQMLELEAAAASAQGSIELTVGSTGQLGISFDSLRQQVIRVAESMGMLNVRGEEVPEHRPNFIFDPTKLQSIDRPIPEPNYPNLPPLVTPPVVGPQGQLAPTPTTFAPTTPQNQTGSYRAPYVSPVEQASPATASAVVQLGVSAGNAGLALGQFAQKLIQPYTIASTNTPTVETSQPTETIPTQQFQPVNVPELTPTTPTSVATTTGSGTTESITRLSSAVDTAMHGLDAFAQQLQQPVVISNVTVTATAPSSSGLEPEQPNVTDTIDEQKPQPDTNVPTLKDATSSFGSFSKALAAAVGSVTDFVSAITKSHSAITGAIGGATSGFGMGSAIGGLFPGGGAIGGAIGAGLGVALGAFIGQKNAQVDSEVSQLSSQYSGIMQSFSQNTDNLNQTIQRMQQLILQAQEDEANSKKGGSQFSSMISQYSQELDSLTNQQSTLMSQMETQLAIFDTATGMQSFLSTLEQIIAQYDKFEGAAGSAKQLAEANSWLQDSLSNFTTSLQNNYTNDEESAIGDALSLNNLLSQRSTLMSNLNDQVIGVLEEGVLTRQQTTGMTKGQKIEQIESQASDQLSTIDQEISLEQYKVSVEQGIFNLAVTKIGLETQLLQLQEQQSSQSLAQIQALQQLIDTLQSGSFNFTTLQSLLNALGYTGAAGLIPPNTTSNPNPGGSGASGSSSGASASPGQSKSNSAQSWDDIASAAYQSRASLGYGNYRGQGF